MEPTRNNYELFQLTVDCDWEWFFWSRRIVQIGMLNEESPRLQGVERDQSRKQDFAG